MQGIKIDTVVKKAAIVSTLEKKPLSRAELANVVGWYKLNFLVADLKVERKIYANRYAGTLEIWK